ncbi:hypothetical protein ACROYT_G041651 [Oculina patagonica]
MNPWLRWRHFADRYNNYLLYSMMTMMTCVQGYIVYKHWKGERIQPTEEELYKKGPIIIKMEEYLRAIAQSSFLTKKRKDPFKEDEDQ